MTRLPFQVNLTKTEKKQLLQAAKQAGVPLATFIRLAALTAATKERMVVA